METVRRIEVCTWDYGTGAVVVDHSWRTAHHHGKRKLTKLRKRAARWYRKAAAQDKATDHCVYMREV